jgi:signal transduction histidine kinase
METRRPSRLRSAAWKLEVALIAGACLAYLFLRDTRAGPAIYTLGSLSACVALIVGPALHRSRALHWWLLAAGFALFALGDGIWAVLRAVGSDLGYPSVADALYLAAYPLWVLGALSLLRGRKPRVGDLLDGLIVAAAAAVLVWTLLVEPIAAQSGSSLLTRFVSGAYPAMDILLLSGLTALVFGVRLRCPSYLALLVGFALTTASDLAYAVLTLTNRYSDGAWLDFVWLASYGLIAVAALHPSMNELADRSAKRTADLSVRRLALLGLALSIGPALATFEQVRTGGMELEVGAASLIAIALVLGRVYVLWRERQHADVALRESETRYRDLYRSADSARRQLAEQNEQLRELDRLKDSFVALVSHELRTPLTSIRGYVELLLEELSSLSADEQRTYLGVVQRNSDRLLVLVNDLLFMAQVEANKLVLDLGETSLVPLAEECLEAARPAADERRISLRLQATGEPVLSADGPRLEQVLDNLLSNALKFTPPGGEVEVCVGCDDSSAFVEVSDTGMGIGAKDVEHLFTPFYRTESAATASVPGTGLGLAISKAIVDAHGGRISVESDEGHGTTFRIEVPHLEISSRAAAA